MQKNPTSTNFLSIKILLSTTLAFFGFLNVASPANAACDFYSSMTTSTKNVLNWSSACTVAAVEGVDNGNTDTSTTNTAQLSLTTGGNITINSTGTLVFGSISVSSGSIAVQAGGTIKAGSPIYILDSDADNWPTNFSSGSFVTATASGYRRLGLMSSYTVVDCNGSAFSLTNTCYSYAQSAYYAYAQSAYYAYAQSAYYAYGQSNYYAYGQSNYYAYGQSSYYAYGQSSYYGYGQSSYYGYSQLYYSSCFLADTQVTMADGSFKNIQDIKAGDVVLSYDLANKRTFPQVVNKLLVHKDVPQGYLTINNNLNVTGNHIMWSPSKNGWVKAETLAVGDTLLKSDGSEMVVDSVTHTDGVNTVYNLSLNGPYHAYFANGTLVHNEKI